MVYLQEVKKEKPKNVKKSNFDKNNTLKKNEMNIIVKKFKTNYNYNLLENNTYIICNNCDITKNLKIILTFKKENLLCEVIVLVTQGNISKDLVLIVTPKKELNKSLINLLVMSNNFFLCDSIVCSQTEDYVKDLFYMIGKSKLSYNFFGLDMYYKRYVNYIVTFAKDYYFDFNSTNEKFDRKIMTMILYYFLGKYSLDSERFNKIMEANIFHKRKVLLISKHLRGFGGCQKTSYQIIELLDRYYTVDILSVSPHNTKTFLYERDYLDYKVLNKSIIKIKKIDKIVEHINNSDYDFIINNKFNELLKFAHKLNKKFSIICHNPKDPLNVNILKGEKYIDTCFVLSNFHKNLLKLNGYKGKLEIYHNYVFDKLLIESPQKKKSFSKKMCFIGRFSKEKNIQLLIKAFDIFSKSNPEHILYIIGSGDEYKTNNKNIVFTGRLTFQQICNYLKDCDYTISTSLIEGKPFSVIEGMSMGIPAIHSNIIGLNELIIENSSGFLFDFHGYDDIKLNFDFNFFDDIIANDDKNVINVVNVIRKAYSIDIDAWNNMSKICFDISNKFCKKYCENKNIENLQKNVNIQNNTDKLKIFTNLKPNPDEPYGGGNISVFYIVKKLNQIYSDFEVVYDLNKGTKIDIYLLIDVNKDRRFKKYGIEEIASHRNMFNTNAKIISRVNDCDVTRKVTNLNSRENKVKKYHNEINYYIYNSNFIKNYYEEKMSDLNFNRKANSVIINGCDQNLFKNEKNINYTGKTFKILTHHWSPNMYKGYQTYYDLWNYCKLKKNIKFIFIGKNVPEMFKEVPINGPYSGKELVDNINDCQIYITDSKWDSCPNHVIEALSCNLPILYSNVEGGARELCQMCDFKVGEIYNNFEELKIKINMIIENYSFYVENIKKSKYIFSVNKCVNSYYNILLQNSFDFKNYEIDSLINLKSISINNNEDNNFINIKDRVIKLIKGVNLFLMDYHVCRFGLSKNVEEIKYDSFPLQNKISNTYDLNLLICSDENYFCGVFALLQSIIRNTGDNLHKVHFNFMVDFFNCTNFSNMITDIESKNNVKLSKTVVFVDKYILDNEIINSSCFNGGGHLLNIGNFSRLMIGEIFNYKKMMYLDSDSIVQYDLYNKTRNIDMKLPMYAPECNKQSKVRGKNFVIKYGSIINCDYDFSKLIGKKINGEIFCFMGAPFVANCKLWENVYFNIIKILKEHNSRPNGIFKLFTMSLQNILFYEKIGNLENYVRCLQDLGSARRNWDNNDLINNDILDWSGIFKPWFKNGLHKNLWEKYNILQLSKNYEINTKKGKIENKMSVSNKKEYKIDPNYGIENIYDCEKYLNALNKKCSHGRVYNILFVTDVKYLIRKMSRVRFWAIEGLGRRKNINLKLLGPGFSHFNKNKSLQQNILDMKIDFDLVMWYKPLDEACNFDINFKLPFKTMLRYNEMWNWEWTVKEIETTKTDIIICHHKNDFDKYSVHYSNDDSKYFFYNPHHGNPDIFKPLNIKKEYDLMISGVCKEKHYPLKYRLLNLLRKYRKTELRDYNIHFHGHPGYKHQDSFKNKNQISYNEVINKSRICLACTSKYMYRLGKYVEIPMAGSVIAGDIPYEDKENFRKFVVNINMEMSDDEIILTLKRYLNDKKKLEEMRNIGLEWSRNHVTEKYVDNIVGVCKLENSESKIYIISDEIRNDHPDFKGQKWICDTLKHDMMKWFPNNFTNNAKECDCIWYLAPWNKRHIPSNFTQKEWFEKLKNTKVISTQHHVDETKLKELESQFDFMKKFTNKYHAICNKTKNKMKKYFPNTQIYHKKLWIDGKVFKNIPDNETKKAIKDYFKFSPDSYLIGSFQKDTEGNTNLPKLSKGPDIFLKIVKDFSSVNENIVVVLTGTRRNYLINEFKKANIKYRYFDMISLEDLNNLYACLDLYIVSSRCEGGPRSVFECGLTKTPIISTDVGIASDLLNPKSIYDANNWETYINAVVDVEYNYNKVIELSTRSYKKNFLKFLLDD